MSRTKKYFVVVALICGVLLQGVSASAIPTTTSNEGAMLKFKNLYLFTIGNYIEKVSNSSAELWKEQVKKTLEEHNAKKAQSEAAEQPRPVEKSEPVEEKVPVELTLEEEVLQIMNQERVRMKGSSLVFNDLLNKVAFDKAKDLYDLNYFAHHSPTYGSLADMLDLYGVDYMSAAENIAKGQKSAAQVMESWLNSEGHNKNIMNPKYQKVGIAHYKGVWVQIFTN